VAIAIGWCKKSDDHLQEDLAKYGYNQETKHKFLDGPSIFLAICCNQM